MEVPDGRSVKALINATPIHSQEGAVESVVVTMQDMTPLEELERLRAEFMGMVSHELQTPLTSIKGSANTLLDEASSLDPAEMRQFHRIISEQADRMRSLIRDLLDVARIETGTLSVVPEPSDTATLVDEARIMFLSSGRRNRIHIDIPPDLPQIMSDRRRIVQVLSNLLSNAAQHSNELTTIRVRAVQKQFQVAVSIVDEGRGIPAERLPFLFRKFSRVEGEDQQGDLTRSGLGLAICKGIVEAHGGRIWAESDGPGQGARFIFTVPIVENEPSAGAAETAPFAVEPRKGTQERTRILVVDDEPHDLRYIRDVLSKSGYDPIVTGEPEDVDHLIAQKEPHLVLLDMMLPGVDGIDSDEGYPGKECSARHFPVGLRPGKRHRQGLRHGGRRLCGEALFAHGAGRADQVGIAPALRSRLSRAARKLCDGRSGDLLCGTPRGCGGTLGRADRDRVCPAHRVIDQCRSGGDPRAAAPTGLGAGELRRRRAGPHGGTETSPKTG